MTKKTDIKTCRYVGCKHTTKQIDISTEEYCVDKRMYYHPDCYKLKQSGSWKDEQTKADLQYIKNGWALHISKTVVYSQLLKCLNELIAQGISSDYLVFTFDYVVKNKMILRYPAGFKYYVDKQEIKDAYKKYLTIKNKQQTDFSITTDIEIPTVKHPPQNKCKNGFQSILGGDR